VVHSIHHEQWTPHPVEEVFAFFSNAFNLESITPSKLKFRVTTPAPIVLETGALIDYKLRVNGIPLTWRTRIELWNPPHEFVDVQLRGPFKLWRHRHQFISERGGTRMIDNVDYQLPLGPLGSLAHVLWVRRDVESIFVYREKVIQTRFTGIQ
jgi:ligand-binding SRPBCC domain-containing protein